MPSKSIAQPADRHFNWLSCACQGIPAQGTKLCSCLCNYDNSKVSGSPFTIKILKEVKEVIRDHGMVEARERANSLETIRGTGGDRAAF